MSKHDEFTYFRIAETVSPIFDKERGKRMEFMRKKLLMDQRELGRKLGVPQQQISKLERGIIPITRDPIPLSKFYKVFGCLTHHVLFDADKGEHNYSNINEIYWREKDRRKGHWGKRPHVGRRKSS